jgi:hypothetical protein
LGCQDGSKADWQIMMDEKTLLKTDIF